MTWSNPVRILCAVFVASSLMGIVGLSMRQLSLFQDRMATAGARSVEMEKPGLDRGVGGSGMDGWVAPRAGDAPGLSKPCVGAEAASRANCARSNFPPP